MNSDEMESVIDFLLQQHARFSVEIGELKEVQKQQAANLDKQTANLESQSANIERLTADIDGLKEAVAAMRDEMREGFDNLIIANEVTRDVAERFGVQASACFFATSESLTNLEQSE
jgi:cell division protein FtsB